MLDEETVSDNLSEIGPSQSGLGLVYTKLDVSHKNLTHIQAVSSYKQLQHISLARNLIEDVTSLAKLHYLVSIDLSHNKLKEWPDLDTMSNVKSLDLSHNQLTSIDHVTQLRQMTSLILDHNEIQALPSSLQNLRQLLTLSAASNSIHRINGLQNLPIKHLDLHGNQIKRVECLEGTRYLQHLDLSDNSIQSLRGLQGHQCLEELLLRNNSVLDITEVKYLMDLRGLRELNLDSNPIQTIAGYRANIVFKLTQISLLDGEIVTPKEKVNAKNTHDPPLQVQASIQHINNLTLSVPLAHKILYSTLSRKDEPYPMLVLVGPMGSGKKQLALRLAAEYPYIFGYVPSHTTRAPYPHEERNREYVFCSEKDWEAQFSAGMFVEHYRGLAGGGKYGLSINTIESIAAHGLASITCMEYEGVLVLKRTHFEPRYVLIYPYTERDHYNYMRSANFYTDVQIQQSINRRKIYKTVNQDCPGFFDMIISCSSIEESYQQLRQLIIAYCGLSTQTSEAGFSTGVSSSENSISSTPEPLLPHRLHDDIPTRAVHSSTSHTKHSDTGGSSQPILAKPWSRPSSSKTSNTRDEMSFFTVSVRYGGSDISASAFTEPLPNKMALIRAAATGKHESSSFASIASKSRKSSNGSRSVHSMTQGVSVENN